MSERSDIRAQEETGLTAFDRALGTRDIESATSLFRDECFWRDLARRANLEATRPFAEDRG
jgi:hypothetical protein